VVGGVGVAAPSQKKYSDELQLHGESFEHRFHWQSGLFVDTLFTEFARRYRRATYYSMRK